MHALVRRALDAFLLFWLVVTLTFILVRAAPGDTADLLVPPSASAGDVARARAEFGLDAPLATQYARWVGLVFSGDLGESFALREPVSRILGRTLPVSLWLGTCSLALTFLLGIGVAFWQVRHAGSRLDTAVTSATIAVYAAPSYWVALTLVAVFTYGAARLGFPHWARLPAFGMTDPARIGFSLSSVADLLRHSVLPVAVLTSVGAAGIARYGRSRLLDLLHEDWVRTARAKGLSTRQVHRIHLLWNALPTLVVLLGLALPGVVAGSVFVETVFAWPGMGRAMLSAIASRDYPVVMGVTIAYAFVVIVANLIADLLLPALDPRRRG
ncbi:MAG: Dipeptide transport system permease protein DppB [Gemmatimonadaceae bacterium]|nr:Dipeptide transport system permease protein DppB [Gemmatimonadaceae bacterium]